MSRTLPYPGRGIYRIYFNFIKEKPRFDRIVPKILPRHCASWSNYRMHTEYYPTDFTTFGSSCKCVSSMDMFGLQLYERIWKEHSHVLFNNIMIVRPTWIWALPTPHMRATSHTSQEPWPWNFESPKETVQKAIVPTHPQNHVVWSRALECCVKTYAIGLSTNCYFNEYLCMRVLTHDKIE